MPYNQREYYQKNKEKINAKRRERRKNDPEWAEADRKRSKEWREKNREYKLQKDREYTKKNAQKNRDRAKKYYKDNTEKVKQYQKDYRSDPDNKRKISERDKNYRENNKEKISQRRKIYDQIPEVNEKRKEYLHQYTEDNREKINKYKNEWSKNKLETDPVYKIKMGLRKRFRLAIKRYLDGKPVGVRGSSSIELLGCSIPEFMIYMEEKFYSNPETGEKMTWDNWKYDGWHIDHIKPLSKFDLSDSKEVEKAVHYTNLQPLWWKENLSKGDKIN